MRLSRSLAFISCLLATTFAGGALRADVNSDNVVNLLDARLLRDGLGACNTDAKYNPLLDINGDGCQDFADVRQLLDEYGMGAVSAEVVQLGPKPFSVDGQDYIEFTFAVPPDELTLADIQLTTPGDSLGATGSETDRDAVRFDWPYGGNNAIARVYLGANPQLRIGGFAQARYSQAGDPSGFRILDQQFVDLGDRRARNLTRSLDRFLINYFPRIVERAASGDACEDNYPLSYDLDGLLALYEATQESRYIEMAMSITDSLIRQAQDYDGDGYLDFATERNPANPQVARFNVALCDWKAGRAVARLFRIVHSDPGLANRYRQRVTVYQRFVERDLLEKWSGELGRRSAKTRFPEGVHLVEDDTLIHRIAHFGEIAVDAFAATGDAGVRHVLYTLLQRVCGDLEDSERTPGAVEWDVFIRQRPASTPIERRYASPYDRISDTSHANGTVAFVLAARLQAGLECAGRPAVEQLTTTFLEVIAGKDPNQPNRYRFADFVDGGLLQDGQPQYSLGRYIEDGWIKLGQIDWRVQSIAQTQFDNAKPVHRLQYHSNLARNYALAHWH